MPLLEHDTRQTLHNRKTLLANENLLYWYKRLYQEQFKGIPNISRLRVLEIGSGTSPLKLFYPNVLTSDIMKLDYLDYVLDAHEIDSFTAIDDNSLDVISMTNVFHHLKDPILVMKKASSKLKRGGKLIFTEPYFSFLSKFIYVHLHHELTDLGIQEPTLSKIEGPLSSANIALPFLIFENRWDAPLYEVYSRSDQVYTHFTSLSYMVTGGISKALRVPHFIYRLFFDLDYELSKHIPEMFASFFICHLTKR